MVGPEARSGRFADLSLGAFVEELGSGRPVPGGGSASAVAGSLAAALVSMVANLSLERPRYVPYLRTVEQATRVGSTLARRFLEHADADAAAYAGLIGALKLPRDVADQAAHRSTMIHAAAAAAARVPLETLEDCRAVVVAAEALAGRSNLNAASDLLVAARLATAAAHGAAENVRANLALLGDEARANELERSVAGSLEAVESSAAEVRRIVTAGGLREPLASDIEPGPWSDAG